MRRWGILSFGLLFLVLTASIAEAALDNSAKSYKKAADYYSKIVSSPKKFSRQKWEKSLNLFKDVYVKYPGGSKTSDALYMTGKVHHYLYKKYRRSSDRENAITIFRVLVRNFAKSKLADDALYRSGEIHLMDKNYEEALTDYRGVLKWFPKGDMAPKAKKRVAELSRKKKDLKAKRVKKPHKKSKNLSELKKIRFWANDSYARVVFDLSKVVHYKVSRSKNSNELSIELLGAFKGKKVAGKMKPTNGLVKYLEVVNTKNGSSKIKIRLQPFETYSTMELSNPERVVVDINREDPARKSKLLAKNKNTGPGPMKGKSKGKIKLMDPPSITPDPALVEAGLVPDPNINSRPNSRPLRKASFAPVLSPAIKIIVIDPGHGGKDPGAIGPTGLKEKDVVLDISKRLRKELLRKCRCKVVLTRNRDVFIPLEERTAFANTQGADLFISIHVNANKSRRVKGVETYFLSPARSKAERYTAARENMISNGTENKNINDLAFILSDMKNTSKINESSFMAASVQNSVVSTVGRKYRIKDNGVKQAMFYVLHGARMPAVLVETSFISNPREEKRLKSANYRLHIAKGIALGVRNYANESRVASLAN